jgi:hypothetical protein
LKKGEKIKDSTERRRRGATMKARVIYCEDWNGKEGAKVETDTGDGWEVESFFPFVAKCGADAVGAEDEKNFVHWRILRKIGELIAYGYKITKIDI